MSAEATVRLAGPDELRIKQIAVAVEHGDDAGREAQSDGDELTIGTAAGNQLKLSDETVSRHHCALRIRPDGVLLQDLGSMNGTHLGGFRVERAYLRDGASFRVGQTKLRFRLLNDEVAQPLSPSTAFGGALGNSPAMRRIFALLPKLASSQSTVLIEGETGTGKGLLAAAIHEASPRAAAPFQVIDCSAIPANLVESELFGHMRGAFTGAHADRAGAFEAAAGGTVFLDEIGELPLDMQPKLLRALEDRQVKRVGGQTPIDLDVRVIAATNRDLRGEVNSGAFRADLFYRLHVVHLRVPALRERREDIPLYAQHFYEQLCPDDPVAPPELVAALMRLDFPGNVRELRGAVERAVILGEPSPEPIGGPAPSAGPSGGPSGAPSGGPSTGASPATSQAAGFVPDQPFRAAKEAIVTRWETDYLRSLLAAADGNVSKAARMARMDRNHLRELIRKRGLG